MSDPTIEAEASEQAQAAETTQGAVEDTTHPWGDDFDANRAWSTITQQREAEKALKEQIAAERAVWDDEDTAEARVREKFPHWFEDDEDDDPEATQPTQVVDPRIEAHEQKLARIEAKEAEQQFEADFTEALGDREVNAKARKWIEAQTVINGNDRDALQAAVDEWFEITAPPAKKPRTPHVPTGGPPAPEAPAGTHQSRVERALERMQAEQA